MAGTDATEQGRAALEKLLAECDWFDGEVGWDGERAYVKPWLEDVFRDRRRAIDALVKELPGGGRYVDAVHALLKETEVFMNRLIDDDLNKAHISHEAETKWKAERVRAASLLRGNGMPQ